MPNLAIRPGDHISDHVSFDIEVRRVAEGGFGVVYMGPNVLDEINGTWLALKTLRPEVLAGSHRARELFLREALTWVGLWPHANILTAETVIDVEDQLFLVLNYATHGSLRDLFAQRPHLAWRVGLFLAQHIAAGLAALHAPAPTYLRPEPVVHRDLKPENVLIHATGLAKITDFGLAKVVAEAAAEDLTSHTKLTAATETGAGREARSGMRSMALRTARGVALGTPAYMAPEQWEDAAGAGPPADCYAFGLLLAELLAGRHALLDLDGPHGVKDWRWTHLAGKPRQLRERAPVLPDAVEELYNALLAKDPRERPSAATALATLQEAARALGEEPYAAPEVFAHTPENEATLWNDWANTYRQFGLREEALARNDRALALDPSAPEVLITRGVILGSLGRVDEAVGLCDSVLAALPPGDHLRELVCGNRGVILAENGRHAEAEEAFAHSTLLMPENTDGWLNRAANLLLWAQEAGRGPEALLRAKWGEAYAAHALRITPHSPGGQKLLEALRTHVAWVYDGPDRG